MTTPTPNELTDTAKAGATYTVYASESGESATTQADMQTEMLVMQISRRSGGRDVCVLAYDLGEFGTRLKDQQTPVKMNRVIDVRLDDPDTLDVADSTPLFWGDLVAQRLELSDDREAATLTARLDPHFFGEVLTGYKAFDVSGAADVTIQDDPVFNPTVDITTLWNMSEKRANVGNYNLWVDVESVETATARTWQQLPNSSQKWSLAEAIKSLCGTCNVSETFVKNPVIVATDAIFDQAPPPDNFRLRRGEYLPAYLNALLPAHGLDWFVSYSLVHQDPDDDTTELITQPAITLYKLGHGPHKELHWQDVGEALDLSKQNLLAVNVDVDVGSLANKVTCHGSHKQYEVTIELYRGWAEADDAIAADDLHRNTELNPDSQFASKPDVWRLWVANEGGDYCGLRTAVKPIPSSPPDLSSVGAFYTERRLKMEDCLTFDSLALTAARRPPYVEYYNTEETAWMPIPQDWEGGGYRVLGDQIGIRFSGETPPVELVDMGADARLRITGTITAEDRISASSNSVNTSQNARTVELFLDVSDRFHYRARHGGFVWDGQDAQGVQTVFKSKFTDFFEGTPQAWPVADRDDTDEITLYAANVLDNEDAAVISATLPLHGIVTSYEIGDLITKIAGREISLNRKSHAAAVKRYLQITGIDWDFERQETQLTVTPVDANL